MKNIFKIIRYFNEKGTLHIEETYDAELRLYQLKKQAKLFNLAAFQWATKNDVKWEVLDKWPLKKEAKKQPKKQKRNGNK